MTDMYINHSDIEWKMVKLGDLCNIRMGQSPEGKFYNDKQIGLPLVQGNADIEDRKTIIRSYTSYITKTCDKGDYILSVRAPVGAVAKATFNACIGRGVCAFSYPNEYLYQYFIFIENQWGKFSTGSTFDSINGPTLKQVKIPIPYKNGAPDLETQAIIAQKLSDMDSLIAAKEKLLAKKRNLKIGAMQKLIKNEESENWKKVKLHEVCDNYTGLTYSPSDINVDGTLVLRSSNIKDGFLDFSDSVYVKMNIPERAIVRKDDVLVCVRNGSKNLIGKCALITEDAVGMAFCSFMTILRAKIINQKFLFYLWQSSSIFNQIQESLGATINQITNTDIQRFQVYIPEKAEQERIVSILSDMDSEISSIEDEVTKFQNLKIGMMQNYFRFNEVEE